MTLMAEPSSNLRAIPASMSTETVAEVDRRLDAIAAEHDARIVLAIESGSRAWGFPSLDSDYDCRFVFVRPLADYLTPWPRRDVVDTPIEGILDVNGWDLGKALQLLVKGNAVIVEWLTSPIVYRGDDRFRAQMLALAREVATRERVAWHYLHLGQAQWAKHVGGSRDIAQKRIFYILRPAATLRWLRLNPREAVAPMHFPTLMEGCDPSAEVTAVTEALMRRKARTRELGTAPFPAPLARFIEEEFALARTGFGERPTTIDPQSRRAAERFLRETVCRYDPQAFASPWSFST